MRKILSRLFNKKELRSEGPRQTKASALEAAKEALIADLKTKGIKFLLSQMSSNEVYSPLILENRVSYCSEDYVSRYADLQSRKLNSPADKKELIELLSDPGYTDQSSDIYCCLSCLCSNIGDIELFDFLMNVIKDEQEERVVVSILSRLSDMKKPNGTNIAPIKHYLVDGTNAERIAASRALCNTDDPTVESLLLDEFKVSDRHSKAMFCVPLMSVGTARSLPVLMQAHKETKDPVLRQSIDAVINVITRPSTSSSDSSTLP